MRLSWLRFPNALSFSRRPTPEEALKWGDSLEKLLLHKCKCSPISSPSCLLPGEYPDTCVDKAGISSVNSFGCLGADKEK